MSVVGAGHGTRQSQERFAHRRQARHAQRYQRRKDLRSLESEVSNETTHVSCVSCDARVCSSTTMHGPQGMICSVCTDDMLFTEASSMSWHEIYVPVLLSGLLAWFTLALWQASQGQAAHLIMRPSTVLGLMALWGMVTIGIVHNTMKSRQLLKRVQQSSLMPDDMVLPARMRWPAWVAGWLGLFLNGGALVLVMLSLWF